MARPTKFDRQTVLQGAIEAFRDAGYCATRMPDLVQATQLQPGSLYAAFESKQGLLEASLEQYAQHGIARIKATISASASPLSGVKAVLKGVVEESIIDKKGCLLVNTLLELSQTDSAIRQRIIDYLAEIETQLRVTLQLAQQNGEVSAEKDLDALAKFLMVNMWGFKVMAKTGASDENIRAALQILLDSLSGSL